MFERDPVRYNDVYFRIAVSLVAAHIIVVLGENATFFQLLVNPDYYRALFFSFIIAYLLVYMVYRITLKLDKKFDWKRLPLQRIGLQFSLALLLPAIAAYLLAYIYFRAFGYDIRHTWYLRYDYPVIVLMLVLLNAYYLSFYFFRRWQESEAIAEQLKNGEGPLSKEQRKELYVVSKGTENIPLPVSAIAYFYRDGAYNFLRTFENEDFLISQTLDEVEQQLPGEQFFRVNRRIIVNYRACHQFTPLQYGKIELRLEPSSKERVIISQKRAKNFQAWLKR